MPGLQSQFLWDGLVWVMKKRSSSLFAVAVSLAAWAILSGSALAQESRTLGEGAIVVRLCPATCVAVNGHGLKSGGKVTVYESKSGWVRVSDFLNRSRLVQSFGNSITRKPALWIASNQLVGATSAQETPTPQPAPAATAEANPAPAAPRRLTTPTFRPGTSLAQQETPEETSEETPADTAEEKPAETETAESKPAETEEPKPVVEAKPLEDTSDPADGTRRVLTWEELQERLAQQAEEQKRRAQLSEAEKAALAKEEADQAAREAEIRRTTEAAQAAKAEEARKAAEAAKAAEAEAAAEAAKSAKAAEEAAAAAEAAKQAELDAAANKKAEEEAAKLAAAKEAEEAAKATEAAAAAAAAEAAKKQTQEEYVPVVSEPIKLGARPKKMTKALLDKRLSKLPTTKSKVKLEAVIALRHYALGLLNSGECKGIAGGGPSAVPGMLYVACSEDPTYLRQFPMKEETW